ncbi:MAG: endonuclease/exonuclease/phosphatase family protein [Candidatus Omnitrophica bacterium]|nr:endonuclease/exonuclease/phosphatase family protein [Candidatus Omnitrophota bacterium]
MKILTLNTWQERGPWRERWDLVVEGIKIHRPELIGLQEIFNPEWAQKVQKRVSYPTLIFPKEPCGLAFLSVFPALTWTCLTYKKKSPTEDYLRYVLFAEFETGSGKLAAFDTHLSWRIPESDIRQRQVDELLAFISIKAAQNETAVMGDFNSAPDSPEIQTIIQTGKFADAYAKRHPAKPGITWDNRNPYTAGCDHPMPDRRIDFLFTRHERVLLGRLKEVQLILNKPNAKGIWPSDHLGVLGEWE